MPRDAEYLKWIRAQQPNIQALAFGEQFWNAAWTAATVAAVAAVRAAKPNAPRAQIEKAVSTQDPDFPQPGKHRTVDYWAGDATYTSDLLQTFMASMRTPTPNSSADVHKVQLQQHFMADGLGRALAALSPEIEAAISQAVPNTPLHRALQTVQARLAKFKTWTRSPVMSAVLRGTPLARSRREGSVGPKP